MSSGALANRRFGEEIACEVFLPQWLNVGPGLGSPEGGGGPWSGTISKNTKKSGKIFYYSFKKFKMAEIVNKTGVIKTGSKDCVNLRLYLVIHTRVTRRMANRLFPTKLICKSKSRSKYAGSDYLWALALALVAANTNINKRERSGQRSFEADFLKRRICLLYTSPSPRD